MEFKLNALIFTTVLTSVNVRIAKILLMFLLFQQRLGYESVLKLEDIIVVKSVKTPIMFHPGYFVFTDEGMFISYPYFGVVMFDHKGNFIKKVFDVSGPICVLNNGNLCCYDVINHRLIVVNPKSMQRKHFIVPSEFQRVWHIKGYGKYVYISLFYEYKSDKKLPLLLRFDPELEKWEVILKGDVSESGGLIEIISDGSILYLTDKGEIVKITSDGEKHKFSLLTYGDGYEILSFVALEKSSKAIIEKYNRYKDLFKIDIFDLKTFKVKVRDLKIPYKLLLGSDEKDRIYIVIDPAVKLNSDQNSKIGVFKLRE